jgi:predicted AAA+ superfamily ATPase
LRWHSTGGAGRFTDFMLPLTFQEFIHLKNRSHLMVEGTIKYNGKGIAYQLTNNIDELNKEFVLPKF